jgi:hypothetical protein
MAVTQADLDALDAAILSSELEVEYQGRRVRFRSVAELRQAYEHARTVLATQSGGASRGSTFHFQFTTQRGD